ncbi:MAG: hypothetical protein K0S38_179 [Candidatus Paceibacter sp.]|jgi:hypothetical protein|nr:hypothetical protein [Candidatus Paceibacter sp.]
MIIPQSGRNFEGEMFGICSIPIEHEPRNVSLTSALKYVKRWNNSGQLTWNPYSPPTKLAQRFLMGVRSALGGLLVRRHSSFKVKMYCAIGTALDFSYGADGVFEVVYHGLDHQRWTTFDLSLDTRISKKGKQKAHFLVLKKDLESPASFNALCYAVAKRLLPVPVKDGV